MKLKAETALATAPLLKRYYAIGEVSELCGVKPHVLRYWEQEFTQLKPLKRRGNRRYYQVADVETVRLIKGLLYQQGFTIQGARLKLKESRSEGEAAALLAAPILPLPTQAPTRPQGRKETLAGIRSELENLLARCTI